MGPRNLSCMVPNICTLTHYDVVSFGVLGVIVLWPVYIIQGILIADTASIMPIFQENLR